MHIGWTRGTGRSRTLGGVLAWALCALPAAADDAEQPAAAGEQPAPAFAWPEAEAYELGTPARVVVDEAGPAFLRFETTQPGLLTVAAFGDADADVTLTVADATGQELPDGWIDWDPVNAPDGEYGTAGIDRPGAYLLIVGTWEGDAQIDITSSFMAVPRLVEQSDPHGRPDQALVLKTGETLKQPVDFDAGDQRDWYVFTPKRDGTIRIQVRGLGDADSMPDLLLRTYAPGTYWEAIEEFDNDEYGDWSRESFETQVTAGEPLYVRVDCWSADEPEKYTIAARWVE